MKPGLVIFDFDGVLVDTQGIINKIEWEYLLQHGMQMTVDEFTKRFSGVKASTIVRTLRKENNIEPLKKAWQVAKEIDEAVLAGFSHQKIEPFKGVKDILQKLPFKKCIASNCSFRILRTLLLSSSLMAYFNGNVFSADMVGRPKPYPDLFLYAARSMGVAPDQCLVIEDSEAGIKAAVAAGMKAWGFLGGNHIKSETGNKLLSCGAELTFLKMDNLFKLLGLTAQSSKEGVMIVSDKGKNNLDFSLRRADMVKFQLEEREIKDKRVLKAMGTIPRHLFVPHNLRNMAYSDSPLPIGYDQTISQPYIVARMCEAACLSSPDKVLEIGTGSGYQAAVLSLLSDQVYTIEIIEPLGESAAKLLKDLGYNNVHIKIGDGYSGWPEHAPYNAILITAAAEKVPQPLIDQLALHGRLIMPLGDTFQQELIRITRTETGLKQESLGPVRFVPFRRASP